MGLETARRTEALPSPTLGQGPRDRGLCPFGQQPNLRIGHESWEIRGFAGKMRCPGVILLRVAERSRFGASRMGCAHSKGRAEGATRKKIAAKRRRSLAARSQFLAGAPLVLPPAEQPAATGIGRGALIVGPTIAVVAVGIPIPPPGRGAVTVALADLDAALRLAAHHHHEIGGLARLVAQSFVGNDD